MFNDNIEEIKDNERYIQITVIQIHIEKSLNFHYLFSNVNKIVKMNKAAFAGSGYRFGDSLVYLLQPVLSTFELFLFKWEFL